MNRARRMRRNPLIRGMVRETRVSSDGLIYPIFFEEGKDIKAPIASLDGQFRYSPDRAKEAIDECLEHGI
ncbi:MAG: porphobilinogen synthase, partial [Firmicutes bacterium]|nr:porphobilinogen synthase [Bacillota bacterium]